MSESQETNPFDDGYSSSSKKDYQQEVHSNRYNSNSHQHQTAGESQYQDQPPSLRNPLSPPPVSAPPPPPPSPSEESSHADEESMSSVRSVQLHDNKGSDDSSSTGFPTYPTPPSMKRTAPKASHEHRYSSSNSHASNSHAGGSSQGGKSNSSSYYSSYQNNTRAAPVPMITNYGESPSQTYYGRDQDDGDDADDDRISFEGAPMLNSYTNKDTVRGDVSLRPNTGQTNSEIGGIGSLREVTARLRWMTIACTLAALIWEGFAFPARLLVHTWDHPAKVVLGGYLAFFCLLLLGVELNAPLRHLFGVLYHPLGRGFLLTLMSTMAYGISIAWWELLLCVAFAGCSCGYVYAYAKYPEYRRWQTYNDNRIWADMRYAAFQQQAPPQRRSTGVGEGSAHWADPADPTTISARSSANYYPSWRETQRETQALLHQV